MNTKMIFKHIFLVWFVVAFSFGAHKLEAMSSADILRERNTELENMGFTRDQISAIPQDLTLNEATNYILTHSQPPTAQPQPQPAVSVATQPQPQGQSVQTQAQTPTDLADQQVAEMERQLQEAQASAQRSANAFREAEEADRQAQEGARQARANAERVRNERDALSQALRDQMAQLTALLGFVGGNQQAQASQQQVTAALQFLQNANPDDAVTQANNASLRAQEVLRQSRQRNQQAQALVTQRQTEAEQARAQRDRVREEQQRREEEARAALPKLQAQLTEQQKRRDELMARVQVLRNLDTKKQELERAKSKRDEIILNKQCQDCLQNIVILSQGFDNFFNNQQQARGINFYKDIVANLVVEDTVDQGNQKINELKDSLNLRIIGNKVIMQSLCYGIKKRYTDAGLEERFDKIYDSYLKIIHNKTYLAMQKKTGGATLDYDLRMSLEKAMKRLLEKKANYKANIVKAYREKFGPTAQPSSRIYVDNSSFYDVMDEKTHDALIFNKGTRFQFQGVERDDVVTQINSIDKSDFLRKITTEMFKVYWDTGGDAGGLRRTFISNFFRSYFASKALSTVYGQSYLPISTKNKYEDKNGNEIPLDPNSRKAVQNAFGRMLFTVCVQKDLLPLIPVHEIFYAYLLDKVPGDDFDANYLVWFDWIAGLDATTSQSAKRLLEEYSKNNLLKFAMSIELFEPDEQEIKDFKSTFNEKQYLFGAFKGFFNDILLVNGFTEIKRAFFGWDDQTRENKLEQLNRDIVPSYERFFSFLVGAENDNRAPEDIDGDNVTAMTFDLLEWLSPSDFRYGYFATRIDGPINIEYKKTLGVTQEIIDVFKQACEEYLAEMRRQDNQEALLNFVETFNGARGYDGRKLEFTFSKTSTSTYPTKEQWRMPHTCFNYISVYEKELLWHLMDDFYKYRENRPNIKLGQVSDAEINEFRTFILQDISRLKGYLKEIIRKEIINVGIFAD